MAIFNAITFVGKKTASKALDTVEETNDYIWLDDLAVLSRGKHGHVRIDSTWAQSDTAVGASGGWGAITGALIGALMGPGGALAGGLMGGGLGHLLGATANIAVSDPRLDDFAASLKNDTSALVLVSDEGYADEFGTVFAPYGGTVIETELDENDINALKKAIKA